MRKQIVTVAAAAALSVGLASAAFAQATNVIDFNPLWTQFEQFIIVALSTIAAALMGYATTYLRSKWGINVDQAAKDKVLAFAEIGAGMVLARVKDVANFEIAVGNPLIASGANWVIAQVGPELTKLGVTKEREKAFIEALLAGFLGKMTKDEPDQPGAMAPATIFAAPSPTARVL